MVFYRYTKFQEIFLMGINRMLHVKSVLAWFTIFPDNCWVLHKVSTRLLNLLSQISDAFTSKLGIKHVPFLVEHDFSTKWAHNTEKKNITLRLKQQNPSASDFFDSFQVWQFNFNGNRHIDTASTFMTKRILEI